MCGKKLKKNKRRVTGQRRSQQPMLRSREKNLKAVKIIGTTNHIIKTTAIIIEIIEITGEMAGIIGSIRTTESTAITAIEIIGIIETAITEIIKIIRITGIIGEIIATTETSGMVKITSKIEGGTELLQNEEMPMISLAEGEMMKEG